MDNSKNPLTMVGLKFFFIFKTSTYFVVVYYNSIETIIITPESIDSRTNLESLKILVKYKILNYYIRVTIVSEIEHRYLVSSRVVCFIYKELMDCLITIIL